MQRVPKKTNEVKADLKNSTADSLTLAQGDDHLDTFFEREQKVDSHPERRVKALAGTRSRTGITLVRSDIDD